MLRFVPFVFGLAFGACACAQEVRGTVFEIANPGAPRAEWKRAPSAGAFVIVHWTGRRPGFGHYESVCLQAAIARTVAGTYGAGRAAARRDCRRDVGYGVPR